MLKEGAKAPAFEVSDHTGRTIRLSDYQGKSVVLWFYPKADTPGWTAEGRGFRDLKQQFVEKNTQILGISFDTAEENRAFAKKFDFNFPLLCDTQRSVGMAYGACDGSEAQYAKRISYLIDPEGTIRKAYPAVDAAKHPQEVLRDI